jgi:hypothetical protein
MEEAQSRCGKKRHGQDAERRYRPPPKPIRKATPPRPQYVLVNTRKRRAAMRTMNPRAMDFLKPTRGVIQFETTRELV